MMARSSTFRTIVANTPDKPSLLIVDDDPLIVDTLAFFLARDFAVVTAASRAEALTSARQLPQPPVLALVDLGLPPTPHRPDEGLALIPELLALAPTPQIVVLSGQNDEANGRHARALGAADFIAKPADPEQLRQLLLRLLSYQPPVAGSSPATVELVGASPPMDKLRLQVRQYADSPYPVLIEGESGSGKEIVANLLHQLSGRCGAPCLALNCAAISPNLVEPTLFGHAKGAFTGAVNARTGYFEDAADGTLFLDEIGELPLDLQPKLLRVLENGQYQRVGETQQRISRARVIAATNRDLRREVREGRFRADLYHRLSVFTINVPPLREMGEDRLRLLDHFRHELPRLPGQADFALAPEAVERWRGYHFPGNVRELRNIVVRLMAKHAGRTVSLAELEDELDIAEPAPLAVAGRPESDAELSGVALRQLQCNPHFSLDDTLLRWEAAYIAAAQQLTHGNVSQAARLLGINRTTLYNRMEVLARSREPSPE
jgi:two-component system nitrogen regulation response regulator GlnG